MVKSHSNSPFMLMRRSPPKLSVDVQPFVLPNAEHSTSSGSPLRSPTVCRSIGEWIKVRNRRAPDAQ